MRKTAVKGWLQVLLAKTTDYLVFPFTETGETSAEADQREEGEAQTGHFIIIQFRAC